MGKEDKDKKRWDIDADTYTRFTKNDKDAEKEIREKEPIPRFINWLRKRNQ
jgi:hypothetical protein